MIDVGLFWCMFDLVWGGSCFFYEGVRFLAVMYFFSDFSSLGPPWRPKADQNMLYDFNIWRTCETTAFCISFISKNDAPCWYREVEGSFLSPFYDHFCFSHFLIVLGAPGGYHEPFRRHFKFILKVTLRPPVPPPPTKKKRKKNK